MTKRDRLIRIASMGMREADLLATVEELTDRALEIDKMNGRLVDAARAVLDEWTVRGDGGCTGMLQNQLRAVVEEAEVFALGESDRP